MDEQDAVQSLAPSEQALDAPVGRPPGAEQPAIDVQLLADKVYALMIAELQVAIMRRGSPPDAALDW
jgi:hypothetical protein